MFRLPWPLVVALVAVVVRAPALSSTKRRAPPSPPASSFSRTRVRPVLVERCFECHGPDSTPEGNLRLDSLASMLAGGDLGPALKPGDAQASLLVRAINHGDVVEMPPKTKLPAREIADLSAWVAAGATWPDAATAAVTRPAMATDETPVITDEQRSFWAFQPPRDPPVPPVIDVAWPQSPLDHFVLAGLEARGARARRTRRSAHVDSPLVIRPGRPAADGGRG